MYTKDIQMLRSNPFRLGPWIIAFDISRCLGPLRYLYYISTTAVTMLLNVFLPAARTIDICLLQKFIAPLLAISSQQYNNACAFMSQLYFVSSMPKQQ